jgi:nucleotide-binding universal stress UspA family protein
VRSGTILIGYDGTRASEHALREAAELLGPRRALVVVVWKAGLAFELIELPTSTIGLPPAPIDLRTAMEVDRSLYEAAQDAAGRAAGLARSLGLDAEAVVVAEPPEIPVSETLLRVADERDAAALVVGAHGHGTLLGTTSRAVIRHARRPVLVVREPAA